MVSFGFQIWDTKIFRRCCFIFCCNNCEFSIRHIARVSRIDEPSSNSGLVWYDHFCLNFEFLIQIREEGNGNTLYNLTKECIDNSANSREKYICGDMCSPLPCKYMAVFFVLFYARIRSLIYNLMFSEWVVSEIQIKWIYGRNTFIIQRHVF